MAVGSWAPVALAEILEQTVDPVRVEESADYKQVTVRIRGRGLALRKVQPGSKIATKRQFRIATDQLLVSKIDARNGAFGVVPDDLDGAVVTQDFPVFSIDHDRALPEFIGLVVGRPDFWDECLLASEGTTNRVRLNLDEFLQLEIELPSLSDQAGIVEADGAVADAIRAAEAERAAAFTALEAAVERLIVPRGCWEDLREGWALKTLGGVADVRSGITKGRKTVKELRSYPFLRAANVQNGYLDLAEIKAIDVTGDEVARFQLESGDLLMVEGGNAEHLGRGWIWESQIPDCLHQNHVFRARPNRDEVEPRFLAYAIGASPARAYCLDKAKKTTNLASVNKTQISGLPVPVPPRAEQAAIVAKLDAIREAAVAARRTHARLVDVRTALVDALLSGERRVRESPTSISEDPVTLAAS